MARIVTRNAATIFFQGLGDNVGNAGQVTHKALSVVLQNTAVIEQVGRETIDNALEDAALVERGNKQVLNKCVQEVVPLEFKEKVLQNRKKKCKSAVAPTPKSIIPPATVHSLTKTVSRALHSARALYASALLERKSIARKRTIFRRVAPKGR